MRRCLLFILLALFTVSLYAQRGCCSWHGGVAGCDPSSGRQICRDGSLSPSCTCLANLTASQFGLSRKPLLTSSYQCSMLRLNKNYVAH